MSLTSRQSLQDLFNLSHLNQISRHISSNWHIIRIIFSLCFTSYCLCSLHMIYVFILYLAFLWFFVSCCWKLYALCAMSVMRICAQYKCSHVMLCYYDWRLASWLPIDYHVFTDLILKCRKRFTSLPKFKHTRFTI